MEPTIEQCLEEIVRRRQALLDRTVNLESKEADDRENEDLRMIDLCQAKIDLIRYRTKKE